LTADEGLRDASDGSRSKDLNYIDGAVRFGEELLAECECRNGRSEENVGCRSEDAELLFGLERAEPIVFIVRNSTNDISTNSTEWCDTFDSHQEGQSNGREQPNLCCQKIGTARGSPAIICEMTLKRICICVYIYILIAQ